MVASLKFAGTGDLYATPTSGLATNYHRDHIAPVRRRAADYFHNADRVGQPRSPPGHA